MMDENGKLYTPLNPVSCADRLVEFKTPRCVINKPCDPERCDQNQIIKRDKRHTNLIKKIWQPLLRKQGDLPDD
jgi:hypothetical protein